MISNKVKGGATIYWFTGLSGAGKSKIAEEFEKIARDHKLKVKIIDGDDVRNTYPTKLGFSRSDVQKNNELIAKLCLEKVSDFDIILVPVISPYEEIRNKIAEILFPHFRLVYFAAPLEVVVKRDVKGLYQKALIGEIGPMLGTTQEFPYEIPPKFDIKIDSTPGADSVEAAVKKILDNYLNKDFNLGSKDS